MTKGDAGLHGLGMMVCVRFRGFVVRDRSAPLPVRHRGPIVGAETPPSCERIVPGGDPRVL